MIDYYTARKVIDAKASAHWTIVGAASNAKI